jgi:hypothetical protein
MCTLSWIREGDRYTVFFNRDEQRTRAPGLPPVRRDAGAVAFVSPTDPESGGSWIATNTLGVTVLVLNRYDVAAHAPSQPLSRGILVTSLADLAPGDDAEGRLRAWPLARVRPFTLAVFRIDEPAQLLGWDGAAVTRSVVHDTGLVATSSSLDQAGADRLRRALFKRAVAADEALFTRLHQDHAGERRALAPCMHRDDARTVSFTRVRVRTDLVEMHYQPGSPCEGLPLASVEIARVALTP